MDEIRKKLLEFFSGEKDVKVLKKDGASVVITGDSLNIFRDPILGETKDGKNVVITISEIQDVVSP